MKYDDRPGINAFYIDWRGQNILMKYNCRLSVKTSEHPITNAELKYVSQSNA